MFQLMQNVKKSLQRGIPPFMDFKSQDFTGYSTKIVETFWPLQIINTGLENILNQL